MVVKSALDHTKMIVILPCNAVFLIIKEGKSKTYMESYSYFILTSATDNAKFSHVLVENKYVRNHMTIVTHVLYKIACID